MKPISKKRSSEIRGWPFYCHVMERGRPDGTSSFNRIRYPGLPPGACLRSPAFAGL